MARDDNPGRAAPGFTPVPVRPRHDGWAPDKQVDFIEALAESGCVDEACKRVGMSRGAAYALRTRNDAISFRLAWDAALDYAIRKLSDAAFSRALNGVSRPVFYKGEMIGERRYYDERLTMFLLRYRDPERYGAWNDRVRMVQTPLDFEAQRFAKFRDRVQADAYADEFGMPRDRRPFPARPRTVSEEEYAETQSRRATPAKPTET